MTTETNIRELLELAARALDCDGVYFDRYGRPYLIKRGSGGRLYLATSDGDSARMRSALGIGTNWYFADTDDESEEMYGVACQRGIHSAMETISDHNNNRDAALRMCALRVAADIGRMK